MSKYKRIKVKVESEIDVLTEFYGDMSNEEIKETEKDNWHEWVHENIKKESIEVTDVEY